MIRHIVLFRMKKGLPEADRDRLVDALKGLREKVPCVRDLEVGIDVGEKHNSYDIALNSVFNSFDDVEAYAVHPEHVKVVELVKELCSTSVKVDYEF